MAAHILPLLSTLIPGNIAQKALSKINPNLANFFQGAVAAGYGADQAIDFLRDKFQNPSLAEERKRLATSKNLRPDERSSRQKMKREQRIPETLEAVGKIGSRIAGGLLGAGLGKSAQQEHAQQEQQIPQHIPGLGQYQGEHVPGLGQIQQQNLPGLGQYQGEHGPAQKSDRELGLSKIQSMKKKKAMIDQLQSQFEQEFGANPLENPHGAQPKQGGNTQAQLLKALQDLQQQLRR